MDDAWCHGRVGNCATCHGLWCAAAMLEASPNQTAERLPGVASKSVEELLQAHDSLARSLSGSILRMPTLQAALVQ